METVVKPGMKCEVLKINNNLNANMNSGSHGTRIGDPKVKIEVDRVNERYDGITDVYDTKGRRYFAHELQPIVLNVAYFVKDLKKYEKKIEKIKEKINFLEENNLSEYSDEKFKAFQAIKISKNSDLSVSEKIKMIEKML